MTKLIKGMEKPIYKERQIDYKATLDALEPAGDYIVIPSASSDISSIRSIVCRAAKDMAPRAFEVHKTINGFRIDRTA